MLSGRVGGMQCVSFGPELTGAHSTVGPFFEVLVRLLTRVAAAASLDADAA